MADVELPLELITEILTRLPVKPLSRFKCVSKSWNSLISSLPFITRHFKSNPNPNIIIASHHCLFSASISDNNDLHFTELNHPFKNLPHLPDNHLNVVDSCNGILLLCDTKKSATFLYNPANATYRLLPPIRNRTCEFFGFGYDSYYDDYKVVRIYQDMGVSLEICVYGSRENVWKIIKDESASVKEYVLFQPCGVGFKGMLYFLAVNRKLRPVFKCFDVRTESFSSIVDFPELDSYDVMDKVAFCCRELHGAMYLLVNYYSEGENMFNCRGLLYADLWEWDIRESGKKGSWVKLFRVRKSQVAGKGKECEFIRLVTRSKDKGRFLIEANYDWFGWYDLVTKRVTRVTTHGSRVEASPRICMTYVESLVSVSIDTAVSVTGSKGGTKPKKTVNKRNEGDFLSKGFKLRL